jgi:uncharacterized phage protein gp47/JayE
MSKQHQTGCACGCCNETDAITPLKLVNNPGLSALRYRVGTHGSFKQSMLKELSAKSALKKLTSRYDDDHAVATIDAWATVLDVLSFYQERIINEGYLRTATERMSVLELARQISYTLKPGVAAATYLAFGMNESVGAPSKATIAAGTKVQSVPEQDQLPQLFETTEEIEARVEWNGIKVQSKRKYIPVYGDKEIYLQGISTGLQPGDGILMIGDERLADKGSEHWDFRKIKTIKTNTDLGYTKITWGKGLGKFSHNVKVLPAAKNFKVYALRQRANLFGYNAPEWRVMPKEVRDRFLKPFNETSDSNTDPEWKNFNIQSISSPAVDTIHLDAVYSKIIKDSWIIVSKDNYDEVYQVDEAVESSRKNFTLASKTTAVKLSGENLIKEFNTNVRDAVVYAQSEELAVVEMPVEDFLKNDKEITLEKLMPNLLAGKNIIIAGQRKRLQINEASKYPKFTVEDNILVTRNLVAGDSLIVVKKPEEIAGGKTRWTLIDSGGFEGTIQGDTGQMGLEAARTPGGKVTLMAAEKADEMVSEFHSIDSLKNGADPTIIVLASLVSNLFDPPTVSIYANVAAATHGETKTETLGSGNASQVFQKFVLKQKPLTYISAATASGIQTTLEMRVNDILWAEVSSFYGIAAGEKVYVVSVADDGTVTVQFGDGITGSRLPTGTENVKATYRVGIGLDGMVSAGQLSMLMTPKLGVNKVANPLEASGAADPEQRDEARENAPLTVLTLDRIVSARDFEDFTRAFAGIGKARADMLWKGEQQVVYISIAGADEEPVDKTSSLYTNLLNAIKLAGHSNNSIIVENFQPLSFSVKARILINSNYDFELVKENVEATLKENFSFDSRDFGQDVTPAEIIAAIQAVDGVVFTDLEMINNKNPFAKEHFRIVSEVARVLAGNLLPAQLLVINEKDITITQIPA